jgi:ribosome-dependent ATPase
MQFTLLIMLPSVLLTGFVFPRSEMPWPLYLVGFILPVTYFLEIVRGVVLRSADALDLARWIVGLGTCMIFILGLSVMRFRKNLD